MNQPITAHRTITNTHRDSRGSSGHEPTLSSVSPLNWDIRSLEVAISFPGPMGPMGSAGGRLRFRRCDDAGAARLLLQLRSLRRLAQEEIQGELEQSPLH